MSYSWILDYATPTTIKTNVVVAPTGFLRSVLVVIKSVDEDLAPITITSKPTLSISKVIDGLFDAGMSRVSYIRKADTDLSALSLKNNYFTILFDKFSLVELEDRDLGNYDGVLAYEIDSLTSSIELKVGKVYNQSLDGFTLGLTFGEFLSMNTWSSLVYASTTANVSVVEDDGLAKEGFESRLIVWGKDDLVGKKLVSAFIGGRALPSDYVEREIAINCQVNNLKMLANGLYFNNQDVAVVNNVNTNYIDTNYLKRGTIKDFTYKVVLGTDGLSYISDIKVEAIMPVYFIYMNILGE